MFIAHRTDERKAFVLTIPSGLANCAGLGGLNLIFLIVASMGLGFRFVLKTVSSPNQHTNAA